MSDHKSGGGPHQTAISFRAGVPQFDADEFRAYVDGFDITEDEKLEYLRTVWLMALTFVDISFGTNSAQHAMNGAARIQQPDQSHADFSGQDPAIRANTSEPVTQFNEAARDGAP